MKKTFDPKGLNVIGWEKILPELVAFFITVKKVKEEGERNGFLDLSPCNLFLTGLPGTNKTGAAVGLAKFFGFVSSLIDVSTVDDVGEIVGITNLHALNSEGKAELIRGEIAQSDIAVFDEILNIAPHVSRQLRQLLQGHYKAYGQSVQLDYLSIISTGNTDTDMEGFGQMVPLDLPNAKRFMMTVKVPSLREMSREAQRAIIRWKVDSELRRREIAAFAEKFIKAASGAYELFEKANRSIISEKITEYILTILSGIEGTSFVLEGREAQLFQVALTAGVALCWSDPANYELDKVVWQITKSFFSYVELMGAELDQAAFDKLQLAHKAGMEFLKVAGIEAAIFSANSLAEKIRLMVAHRHQISAITKLQIVEEVVNSRDLALKVAVAELLSRSELANEPAELRGLIERSLPQGEEREIAIRDLKVIAKLAQMNRFEQIVYKFYNFDESVTTAILRQARQYLEEWR